MFVEPVRIVADWLRGAAFGVDHFLPLVPRDGGDAQPPLLGANIPDETLNGLVALNELPGPFPCLAISLIPGQTDDATQGADQAGTGTSTVLIRYATSTSSPEIGTRDAGYTLRAVAYALRELHKEQNAASRTRNKVQLYSNGPIVFSPLYEPLQDAVITGAVRIQYYVRDFGP